MALYQTKIVTVEQPKAPKVFGMVVVDGERLRVLSVREVGVGRYSLKVAPGGRLGTGRNDERVPRRTRRMF